MMHLASREPKGNLLESMDLGFLLQVLLGELIEAGRAVSARLPGLDTTAPGRLTP